MATGIDLDTAEFRQAAGRELRRMKEKLESGLSQRGDRAADQMRQKVAVLTGETQSSIRATSGRDGKGPFVQLQAKNPSLEFGTSKMRARPFFRPALQGLIQALRRGR